jgi:hypothetical protein
VVPRCALLVRNKRAVTCIHRSDVGMWSFRAINRD